MTRIYDKKHGSNNDYLVTTFTVGQDIILYDLKNHRTLTGKVASFPRNSINDDDLRMTVKPVNNSFLGILTISMLTNDYGQYHISEIDIYQ